MIEIIKNIAVIIGCLSTIIGLILTISKTIREGLGNYIKKALSAKEEHDCITKLESKLDEYIKQDQEFKQQLKEDMEIQKEFSKDQCRNTIKDIFYRYCKDGEMPSIPIYEYKTATSTYETYKKLKGNSFIDLLMTEMDKWKLDCKHAVQDQDCE